MWNIVLLVTCLLLYSWNRLRYFRSRGVCTLPAFPLFGNLTAVTFGRENFVDVIAAGYNKFKDQRFFGIYQYMRPTLVVRDPELIKQLMVKDFNAFHDRGVHVDMDIDSVFGRNLIMLKGLKWKTVRTAVTPAFSGSRIRGMAPLMVECARAAVRHLDLHVTKKTVMDLNKLSLPYMNDVIASCAFGFAVDTYKEPDNFVFKLGQTAIVSETTQIMKMFGYANAETLMKLLKIQIIATEDAEKFTHLFRSALNARKESSSQHRPDFIQTLTDISQGKLKSNSVDENIFNNSNSSKSSEETRILEKDLVSQAVLFYIAGFDTSANLISFFLCEMAANPLTQERLYNEIQNLPDDGDLYEAVQNAEYLEMCVCEVLRLWPLIANVDRKSTEPYDFGPATPGKQSFKCSANLHIWFPIFAIHHDNTYWPDPDVFDPERFSKERKASIKPFTYMPFGAGPRHCIGSRFATQAAKVFLVHFFKKYRVKDYQGSRQLHPQAFVLRPKDGFKVVIEPR